MFSFARNDKISVRKFHSQDAYSNFFTPLSMEASAQLTKLVDLVQGLTVEEGLQDQWTYIWPYGGVQTTHLKKHTVSSKDGSC